MSRRVRLNVAAPALLAVAALAVSAQTRQAVAPWPTNGWATATLESQGLPTAPFDTLDSDIRNGAHGNVDRSSTR